MTTNCFGRRTDKNPHPRHSIDETITEESSSVIEVALSKCNGSSSEHGQYPSKRICRLTQEIVWKIGKNYKYLSIPVLYRFASFLWCGKIQKIHLIGVYCSISRSNMYIKVDEFIFWVKCVYQINPCFNFRIKHLYQTNLI